MGSDLDIGMRCVKYMLFITNMMFVIIGFLLIAIGTATTSIYNNFDLFIADHYFSPAALLVAVGIIIFFVSLFGCIGAMKGSTCLVNMYGICLILLLILQVSAAIAAYAMRGTVRDYVQTAMRVSMDDYLDNSYVRSVWDSMQCRFQCCGVENYVDWSLIVNSPFNETVLPESCLDVDNRVFQYGCYPQVYHRVSESALLVGTAAICVAIVQGLAIIFAFMLAKSIRRIKTAKERRRQENRARLYEQLARGTDQKPTPVIYEATNA